MPFVAWAGIAVAVLLLAAGAVFATRRGGNDDGAATPTAGAAAAATRSAAIDRRLAERDGAAGVEEYSRVLDSLQRKLNQSGESIATCAETGRDDLARRGQQVTTLEMLNRIDAVVQPQSRDLPQGYALTCREAVRALVGS